VDAGGRLRAIAESVAHGERDGIERRLAQLFVDVERAKDPAAIACYVFGAALARRAAGEVPDEPNLYLSRFDVPQIHLFNRLAREVPLVGLPCAVANRCIARRLAGQAEPTLIDIGIGTGRQMVSLLELLSAASDRPRRVRIIGIEPSGWSLELAQKNVREAGRRLGIDVDCHAVPGSVEALPREEWLRLARLSPTRPVVNAAFALHHVADVDGRDTRDDVLLRLRSLGPQAIVLAEPDVDHHEPDFLRRFETCWRHFSAVFALVDELPIASGDREALKVCFFAREIADIVGAPDDRRSARHESAAAWTARLARTGYSARAGGDEAVGRGPVVTTTRRATHVSLDYRGEPLIAILEAVPVDGTFDVAGALARAPAVAGAGRASEPIDATLYLAALGAVARADEVLHAHEESFLAEQARVFGAPPETWRTASLDDALARAASVSRVTREAIVRDLVFLARLDDHYATAERGMIAAIAMLLGLSFAEFARIEDQAALPPVLGGTPSWFRELWFLGWK
jgi:hypothetical protein